MALPLLLLPAIVAGVAGVGAGVHGAVKMGNANSTMEEINDLHERNIESFRRQNVETCLIMDTLGMLELDILKSFGEFSKVFEKVRDKPEFKYKYEIGVILPEFKPAEIKEVSIGAVALINLLQGGAAGAAGGFAAAGAVPAAIMSIGYASTGTAIATLSGQAAVNAMLAWLGGGSLSTGGGGIVLGTIVLNAATLGVGLLIGGIIFNISGSSLSKKVDKAREQVEIETASVEKICSYLHELSVSAKKYYDAISKVRDVYSKQLRQLRRTVNVLEKTNYHSFTEDETMNFQNTILLVQLLHEMCKVKLVLRNETEKDINTVNHTDIEESIANSTKVLDKLPSSSNYAKEDIDMRIDSLTSEADEILSSYD